MTIRRTSTRLAFALAAAAMPWTAALAADAPAGETAGTRLTIPSNVQATAAVGVVLRVKDVVLAEDVTVVTVSASYSGETSFLELAYTDSGTYLLDENGQKYPLRSPQDNPNLRISRGDTMQGRLVFLGRVAPESKRIRLVFNEGRDGGDTGGPGLSVDVPLTPKG